MSKQKAKKSNVNHVWQTRINDEDNQKILEKMSREDGTLMMTKSEYLRGMLLDGKIKIVDNEVEKFKAYTISKYATNFNQITKRLHELSNDDSINNALLEEMLSQLIIFRQEFTYALAQS